MPNGYNDGRGRPPGIKRYPGDSGFGQDRRRRRRPYWYWFYPPYYYPPWYWYRRRKNW